MQTVELTIDDQSTDLNPSELAEFLYLFPATGRALSRLVPLREHDALREPTPSDLERIYRYKANPKKGGWQSRFKKAFGRHFPEESKTLL